MNSKPLTSNHPWDLTPKEAVAVQKYLADKVSRKSGSDIGAVAYVAGVDTHFHQNLAVAAVVIIRLSDLSTVDYATAVRKIRFPYMPGLLTFREGPAILTAIGKLNAAPDLLIFDGQGIAHPRRCGLASHLGLLLDIPSIGCAKTKLAGRYEEPRSENESYSYLKEGEEIIGAVVRTRSKVKPLFVSIGHRINLQDSIKIVLKCCSKYRLPETTRRADKLARGRLMD
ncbi:MAG: deoxyribonuclease V [Desulfobacterales bacterium]|jgi:deoxyribonuclease V